MDSTKFIPLFVPIKIQKFREKIPLIFALAYIYELSDRQSCWSVLDAIALTTCWFHLTATKRLDLTSWKSPSKYCEKMQKSQKLLKVQNRWGIIRVIVAKIHTIWQVSKIATQFAASCISSSELFINNFRFLWSIYGCSVANRNWNYSSNFWHAKKTF